MKTSKPFRWIAIATIVYIVLLIALYISKVQINNILFSIATGLIVWLFTQTLVKWLEKEEKEKIDDIYKHIIKNFPLHKGDTEEILQIVKEKYLTLLEKKRASLKKEFYDELYKDVKTAKISGIAMVSQIKSIIRENDPLINSLTNNSEVEVQIIISHPDSEFVRQRDIAEGDYLGVNNPCSTDIINSIKLLIDFTANFNNSHLKKAISNNNHLTIRMSKIPLPHSITYVEKASEDPKKLETLLIGMILYHDLGKRMPIYQIPIDKNSDNSLYQNCKKCFDKIYDDSKEFTLFSWNRNGPIIDPRGDLERNNFFKNHGL